MRQLKKIDFSSEVKTVFLVLIFSLGLLLAGIFHRDNFESVFLIIGGILGILFCLFYLDSKVKRVNIKNDFLEKRKLKVNDIFCVYESIYFKGILGIEKFSLSEIEIIRGYSRKSGSTRDNFYIEIIKGVKSFGLNMQIRDHEELINYILEKLGNEEIKRISSFFPYRIYKNDGWLIYQKKGLKC